jgi:hypothetical protein
MSQEFSPASIIITISLHAHVSPGGCCSDTSHPNDIIIQSRVK